MSLDDLENRVQHLEDLVGIEKQKVPIIYIYSKDCSRDSHDPGQVKFGVIPGKVGGPPGVTLTRDQDEPETAFIERCEVEYQKVYG